MILRIIGAVVCLPVTAYIAIGKIFMRKRMYQLLKKHGVKKANIRSVIVMHSFVNKLCGRPEWEVEVMFNDEPRVVYFFKYSHIHKRIVVSSAKHLTPAAMCGYEFKHWYS